MSFFHQATGDEKSDDLLSLVFSEWAMANQEGWKKSTKIERILSYYFACLVDALALFELLYILIRMYPLFSVKTGTLCLINHGRCVLSLHIGSAGQQSLRAK